MKTGITFFALALLCAFIIPACAPNAPSGALEGLRLGTPVHTDNLTVIPVYSDRPENLEELVPLEEALKNKWLEIKETGDGEVSRIVLNNLSDKSVFILSGEVISGAKQDRIISGDRIIRAGQKNIDLDVFCVEAGRWTYESEGFYSKGNMGTSTLREKAQRKAPESQTEIWNEIARVNSENKVASGSDAYQDIYDRKEIGEKLARVEYELRGALNAKAVGVVIGVGAKVKSVDVFESAALFAHYWPVILKSSALTAVTSGERGELSLVDAAKMLAAARNKTESADARVEKDRAAVYVDKDINASSLKTDKGEVHFSAFPVEKEKNNRIRNIDDNADVDDNTDRINNINEIRQR
ncbi:MAG: hypothetical protein JXD23_11985 [Spirochaetales bacterium]|nr:hypothetical protein [Spirochaetales bacterium]